MSTDNNTAQSLLFKIDIKVAERIVTLNVQEGDTIQGLLIKHKMGNHSNTQKFNQLKDKIKTNIQKQMEIKIYSNQLQLANKMRAFLQKQNEQQNSSFHKEFQRTQNRLNQNVAPSSTPLKLLFEKFFNQLPQRSRQSPSSSTQQHQISSQNMSKNNEQTQQNVLKEISLFRNQPKPLKSKASASVNLKHMAQNPKQNPSHKKLVPNKADQDLIKAYQVIWKKSKDKTMRQMAQNTLKELNALPQEDKITQFVQIDQEKRQKIESAYTENDSIISLTPIKNDEKYHISNERSLQNEQFSDSRSFMRRNYRYSYLQEKSNLYYPYEREQKSSEKYSYNRLQQTYINILNKDYDQKNCQNIHFYPNVNKRYSYLDN